MNDRKSFNWQIRTAVLGIFALGFLCGALALNVYQHWYGGASQPTKQQRYEKIFDDLSLSDTQKAEVQQIVSDTRTEIQNLRKEGEPKYLEIRARSDERIQKTMTPEQWEKFVALRNQLRESEKSK